MTADPELLALRVSIRWALDAGHDAEDQLQTAPMLKPRERGWQRLLQLGSGGTPLAVQSEKIANALDEFSTHLTKVAEELDDFALRSAAARAQQWGAAVWSGTGDIAAIYQELKSLMGTLGRCETQLFLGRDVRGEVLE